MDPANASNQSYGNGMGPIRDHLYIVIPMTVAYALIFLSGVVGNVVTCLVIARNKHMHTATNYYLFSLACSDLLLLVSGLPQEMYIIWFRYPYIFGEAFCLLRGLAAETSANATVLTITAFTVERYVAICHPFLSHTMSRLSRAVRLVLTIWLIALGFAIPQALQFGVVQGDAPEKSLCVVKRQIMKHSFEISTFLFFVAPMTLITVLYVLIGLRLRSSHASNDAFCRAEPPRKTERRKTMPQVQLGGMRGGDNKRPTVPLVQVAGLRTPLDREKRPTIVQLSDLRCMPGKQKKPPFIDTAEVRRTTGLEKAASLGGRATSYRHYTSPASRRVLKMLVAVVVAFFICWAPFHAQRLVAIYGTNTDKPPSAVMLHIYGVVTYISGILYYVSTTINPILYHIMSLKFREAFKDSMGRCLGLRTRRSRRPSYSSLCRMKSSTVGRPRPTSATLGCRSVTSPRRDTSASDSLDTSLELRDELSAYMQDLRTRSRTPSLK